MNDDELHDGLIDIFKEIKLLTGVLLHEGDKLAAQINVLKLFLLSHPQFTGLTMNEIRHAFYMNSHGELDDVYRHFNKELNAEFMGDVLRAYLKYKNQLYRLKGNGIKKALGPAKKSMHRNVTTQEFMELIQQQYEMYLSNRTDLVFMSEGLYKMLRQCGAIQIYSRAYWFKQIGQAMLQREKKGNSGLLRKDYSEQQQILQIRQVYKTYRKEGWIPREEWVMVIHTMRKNLYLRFFETMKYFKIRQIFSEIKTN